MPNVLCDQVSAGLRESEAISAIKDVHGRRHYLRVERDFLTARGGQWYLPVGIVHADPRSGAVLIELPHEAETGANRLWVHAGSLLELPICQLIFEWVDGTPEKGYAGRFNLQGPDLKPKSTDQ